MDELPTRIPQAPSASFDAGVPDAPMLEPSVDANHLLPAPVGLPVSAELPEEMVRENGAKQARLAELREHGRNKKLGAEIYAWANEEEKDTRPVTFIPREKATSEYKALLRDASYEVHKNKHLAEAAETNPVTGLPNRRVFDSMLKNAIEQAERGGDKDIAVAVLDLDGFKAVNDTKGHGVGNEVLHEFGIELQGEVRESDVVIHVGGDEFVVVMPGYIRDENEKLPKGELSLRMSERFRNASEKVTKKLGVKIGVSVGIGLYEDGDTPESLAKKADELMYKDKEARKADPKVRHKDHRFRIRRDSHAPRQRFRDRFHRRQNDQEITQ